ncbi:MAG: PfkB family carbohydrate kinase, partial [bacterium]
ALTPAALEARLPLLNRAAVVIAEGNLSAEALRFLGEAVTAPLFADPVSVPKAKKLLPLLPRLTALKPNAAEAMHMTGEKTPEAAALALWRGGVKNVFVSCGGAGMLVAREGAVVRVPPLATRLVNATGGGDACTAALAWAYLRGEPPLT